MQPFIGLPVVKLSLSRLLRNAKACYDVGSVVEVNLIADTAMGGFSGGWGGGGLNPPKFFLTPFRKFLTPLECRFTPWRTLIHRFMPLLKHQEWHIAYDLHPIQNFATFQQKKLLVHVSY